MSQQKYINKLIIGDMTADYPIIQGGMGVGVSGESLAGAVAAAGGIGIISSAQLGYKDKDFENNPKECTLKAIGRSVINAKKYAKINSNGKKGLVGVNVMVALKHYREHVKEAVKAGADVVICGAGLPLDLPELVNGSRTKIAPIISSARACRVILKQWASKYKRTADFLVYEGPKAGGHLGFHMDELDKKETFDREFIDNEIKKIIDVKEGYEKEFCVHIPLIAAGGIFDNRDLRHMLEIGADGVQVASRFVATYECDASMEYKQAYINAKDSDVCIIKSPVGLPGRAINNEFIKRVSRSQMPVDKCYQCLAKCNPKEVPYCITKALINAVNGDIDNGLVFCGANVGRINKITSVKELIDELIGLDSVTSHFVI